MTTILYGIKNCDTVKKARDWMENAGIDYQFHDFRQNGLSRSKLERWRDLLGVKKLINKRSTTWKQLSDAQRRDIETGKGELLILENPTLIKRPVLEHAGQITNGFNATSFQDLLTGKQ